MLNKDFPIGFDLAKIGKIARNHPKLFEENEPLRLVEHALGVHYR
jgi:hypothetical protein